MPSASHGFFPFTLTPPPTAHHHYRHQNPHTQLRATNTRVSKTNKDLYLELLKEKPIQTFSSLNHDPCMDQHNICTPCDPIIGEALNALLAARTDSVSILVA
jgi:hypothetical protein